MSGVVHCARCGRSWMPEVWRELPVEQTLEPRDLAGYVSAWPDGATVQIRACTGCGLRIARRVVVTRCTAA